MEGDDIAEALQSALEIGRGTGLVDLVEIRLSEVTVGQAPGEHVVGGDEDLMGDGEGRAEGAAAGL